MPKIKRENPAAKIYLLIGSDVAEHIEGWEGSEELLSGVELVVAERSSAGGPKSITSGKIRISISNNEKPEGLTAETLQYIEDNRLYL